MDVHVSLTDDMKEFVEERISTGFYTSASDVIHVALRLMELQQENSAKLKWLQQAYREGIESGDAGEIDFEAIKAEGRVRLKQRAAE